MISHLTKNQDLGPIRNPCFIQFSRRSLRAPPSQVDLAVLWSNLQTYPRNDVVQRPVAARRSPLAAFNKPVACTSRQLFQFGPRVERSTVWCRATYQRTLSGVRYRDLWRGFCRSFSVLSQLLYGDMRINCGYNALDVLAAVPALLVHALMGFFSCDNQKPSMIAGRNQSCEHPTGLASMGRYFKISASEIYIYIDGCWRFRS